MSRHGRYWRGADGRCRREAAVADRDEDDAVRGNQLVEMNAGGNRGNLCAHNFQRPADQGPLASIPPQRPDLVNGGEEKRGR
jgi:hypothetical protein